MCEYILEPFPKIPAVTSPPHNHRQVQTQPIRDTNTERRTGGETEQRRWDLLGEINISQHSAPLSRQVFPPNHPNATDSEHLTVSHEEVPSGGEANRVGSELGVPPSLFPD